MSDERQLFQEIVIPHLGEALSLARWLTGNLTDAEDVVQDACVRAYAAIAASRNVNPRSWLLAIVRNTAFTWLAKNRPKTVIATDDDTVFEQAGLEMADASRTATPEAALIKKCDAEQLHGAIASLPLPYRQVLVLREIEELGYQDIARIMSIPVGTVMSRLARARGLLMQRMSASVKAKAGAA